MGGAGRRRSFMDVLVLDANLEGAEKEETKRCVNQSVRVRVDAGRGRGQARRGSRSPRLGWIMDGPGAPRMGLGIRLWGWLGTWAGRLAKEDPGRPRSGVQPGCAVVQVSENSRSGASP